MENITTLIVDDEINARENLRYLLTNFCKKTTIIGEAKNVDEAVSFIKKNKPQLIFLDIEMPEKNGFQLFKYFKNIDFHVIFITAYDQYAIKAFKVSAIDYLLKPIDISLLKLAVKKVEKSIENKDQNKRIALLAENSKKIKKIAIPYKSDYVILDVANITAIQADRMYSIIYLADGKTYIASKKLNYYEELFKNSDTLFRVHRSWIINSHHIHIYSKKEKNIELSTSQKIPLSRSYKDTFEALIGNS